MTPSLSLAEVAEVTGGRTIGECGARLRDVAPLVDAGPDELGLLASGPYAEGAAQSRAGAFLVSSALEDRVPEGRAAVVVEDAHAALIPLLSHFHPAPDPAPGIHPTAVLGEGVHLGADVFIGPYAVLESNVVVGERGHIGAHAVVGAGSRVGDDSVLHAQVVLYAGTILGRRVTVHAGARLGVDGFGYALEDGAFRKVPQVGRLVVEDDVEIGANTCIDRGSIGDTVVGRGTKLDNLIHLAHNVRVGPHCVMAAQVGVAGSTRIGTGVSVGGQAGFGGHLRIADGARISGRAGVIGDVGEGEAVTGFPARDHRTFMRAWALVLRLPELFREMQELRRKVEGSRASGPVDAPPDTPGS